MCSKYVYVQAQNVREFAVISSKYELNDTVYSMSILKQVPI